MDSPSEGSGAPNGVRLSCGAELECSQTEFYHTVIPGNIMSHWGRAPTASSAC